MYNDARCLSWYHEKELERQKEMGRGKEPPRLLDSAVQKRGGPRQERRAARVLASCQEACSEACGVGFGAARLTSISGRRLAQSAAQ